VTPASASTCLSTGLSIVVPVYNSQDSLELLVSRLLPILQKLADGPTVTPAAPAYELVLVNDGSRDQSWAVISRFAAEHPWIRGINLMRNYGQHNALLCGIREARFATIVTIDDDLQNPPEEIPKLLAQLDQGFDVVYGKPRHERHGLWRDLASQITKFVLKKAMGAQTARNISAFRAFRTCLRTSFADYKSPLVSIDVLLTWGTTRFTAIAVQHDPRTIGTSNYTIRKLLLHATNMMTGFSTWPLRLASGIGFAFTVFGILVLVRVLVLYLIQGSPVQGFPFLASIIAIFSGAQLFALGIMGEYLARIHQRTLERPPYAVGARTDGPASAPEIETPAGAPS
jgi:glycosyltransferase involved in cell wall biosynthesis